MAMTPRPWPLAPLFAAILGGQAGCTLLFGPCPDSPGPNVSMSVMVDPATLAAAVVGGLSFAECLELCEGAGESAGTTTTPTTGAGSSGGEPTGAGESGTGTSGSGTSETGTSGSGTSGSGTSETGTSGSTGSAVGGRVRAVGGVVFAGELLGCSADGTDAVACEYPGEVVECVGGRRPAGLRSRAAGPVDALAAWFVSAAHLEAASVPAFERLAAELRELGAPEELAIAAEAAAEDERRHAAQMGAQARRRGAAIVAVELAPRQRRGRVELARENAVEGCVRESWAALLAMHQAAAAEDLEVRALLAGIAVDEVRHAELAWAIDAWLRPGLTAAEVAEVDAARDEAAASLRPRAQLPAALVGALGLPPRGRAEAMWRSLCGSLWAA